MFSLRIAALAAVAATTATCVMANNEEIHPDLQFISFADLNSSATPQFTLNMLPNSVASGAVCLDGSPSGFYFSPGSGIDAYNWMFYFQGGGWCYDAGDCYGRSKGNLGSSTKWATSGSMGGMLSNNPTTNPRFANFTKLWLSYCDGFSFSGNRDDPITFNGEQLYFRGHRIIGEVMKAIQANQMVPANPVPFSEAYDIVLTGCSAGGLATYLHADYFADTFVAPNRPPPPGSGYTRNGRYYVIPISGFFLDAPNVEGTRVYTDQIQVAHYLSNATGGTNAACVAAQQPGNEYLCSMAQYTYAYIKSPIFALNSFYDSWQSGCIMCSEPVVMPNNTAANGNCSSAPGWSGCASNPETCTQTEMAAYANYRAEFGAGMNATTTAQAPGNGGFLVSCHTHCEAQDDPAWSTFTINGITMRDAVSTWMDSPASTPAIDNFHWDCAYNSASSPHACNPTCA